MEKSIFPYRVGAAGTYHDLQRDVAWGCRILAMGGHADLTLGHLSARSPDNSVLIKRKGLALHEIAPDDVHEIDLAGRKHAGRGEVHLESSLHTEIYRARPDVGSVVHTHPPYATALGASSAGLQMVTHEAVLFHDGLPLFEGTPALITERAQGQAVTQALGNHRALLMKNHGVIVVGVDVRWAVVAALMLERAIRFQALASRLGPAKPISPENAARQYPHQYQESLIQESWDYLKRECRERGLAGGLADC